MSHENDSQIVDFLYDDLAPEDRKAFLARFGEEPELASQVDSYSVTLRLVREHGEEIAPSLASTEALLGAARRQARPWYARLFGGWLPALAQRPAVALATVAVLVLGMGVFAFFAGRPGSEDSGAPARRLESRSSAAPRAEKTGEVAEGEVASKAPALLAIRDREAASGAAEPDEAGALAAADQAKAPSDPKGIAKGDSPSDEAGKSSLKRQSVGGALALEEAKQEAPSAPQKSAGAGQTRNDSLATRGGGGVNLATTGRDKDSSMAQPPPAAAPRGLLSSPKAAFGFKTKQEAAPAEKANQQRTTTVAERSAEQARGRTAPDPAPQQAEVRSAPVLYNLANTSLSKGDVNQACELFGALVRTHRDHPRRADALLGWARCEMARGAFGRAETILQQLLKEHPSWRKSAETWLAEIQKQRQQAVLRAQRRAQAVQQKAPAKRAAPRKPTSSSSY